MKLRLIWKIFLILIAIGCITAGVGIGYYKHQMSAVDPKDKVDVNFTIESGTTTKVIAKNLMDSKLIHSDQFFVLYLKINKINNLQASTYKLNRSMDLKQIVEIISKGKGYNPNEINITFKEGKNIRSVAKVISENTNNKYDDVIKKVNDSKYIDSLIEKYWFITKDVKNSDLYYSLEGYLFPNTYTFSSKDVTIEDIFTKMLDETAKVLDKNKEQIEKSKLSVHEILSFASIVELEGVNNGDRPTIASVFYNRIDKGISLGSDVTACYAQKIDDTAECHRTANFNYDSKYNTRLLSNKGLPIGPICNPSEGSISAVLNPTETDYLYFVADKNTKVYFCKTETEFYNTIKELKQKGLWL